MMRCGSTFQCTEVVHYPVYDLRVGISVLIYRVQLKLPNGFLSHIGEKIDSSVVSCLRFPFKAGINTLMFLDSSSFFTSFHTKYLRKFFGSPRSIFSISLSLRFTGYGTKISTTYPSVVQIVKGLHSGTFF